MFYAATAVLLAVSLASLTQILTFFERDREARVRQIARLFADRSLLKTPGEPILRYASLEDVAAKVRTDPAFTAITVTKMLPNGLGERVVYPYYVPALYPERRSPSSQRNAVANASMPQAGRDFLLPWALPPDAERIALLGEGEVLLGYLYLRIDRSALVSVRIVIGVLSLMLLGCVALLAGEFRSQQQALSQTSIELEEKRRELVRLERLALAGQLSANLLHDLRKPVLNIRAELEDLEQDNVASSAAQAARARMASQVEFYFNILRETGFEGLLRNPGEREYVDVPGVIERSLALVRYERRGVEIVREDAPALPPVLAEEVRLIQVFSNLFLNAFQAMQGKGQLRVRAQVDGDRVVVEVEDTGPGIPAAILDKIFQPFFTTRTGQGGSGLGLYIAREVIRELGGDILVASEGVGTRFRVTMPGPGEATPDGKNVGPG